MKERPILFSAPMVRAILSGAKTQTRRIAARPGRPTAGAFWDHGAWTPIVDRGGLVWTSDEHRSVMPWPCPYGYHGDRLWVRETHAAGPAPDGRAFVAYRATCDDDELDYLHSDGAIERLRINRWTPAIHMPRWAARILLDVTEVRVERLQAITEEDARAEGVTPCDRCGGAGIDPVRVGHDPEWCAECGGAAGGVRHRDAFADLWDEINGERASWDSNPWVWVVTFKRAESAAVAA